MLNTPSADTRLCKSGFLILKKLCPSPSPNIKLPYSNIYESRSQAADESGSPYRKFNTKFFMKIHLKEI